MSADITHAIYDFTAKRLDGTEESLSKYRGKVLLIVNVASRCVFTGQYQDLQKLFDQYKDQGLVILGFPCNQFGAQEPGDENQIAQFCSTTYQVSFPMFAKIDVNGPNTHPLYQYLKAQQPGLLGSKALKWNFTKFLVARSGQVLSRYSPSTNPTRLKDDIETALQCT